MPRPTPLAYASPLAYTEPHGSVSTSPPRCLVRRALGRHPTWHSGAAWGFGRFDHGPCREVPYDRHEHEEARRCLAAGGARHHGEGSAGADVPPRGALAGGRGGVDGEVLGAGGRLLCRVGRVRCGI